MSPNSSNSSASLTANSSVSYTVFMISIYYSKGEDTINSSVSVRVKVIPMVVVSPLYVVATEGNSYISGEIRNWLIFLGEILLY